MADVKIALIGAGSFVFGPSVIAQAFRENAMENIHLALVDLDAEAVELMAGVGRRVAREAGLAGARVTAHTDREAALAGADFVIHSASPQIARRHQMDRDLIAAHYPDHLITEFGGVAGISYTLRQIALAEKIAADMKRLCPDAWLLDVANPLPRVCQAAHEAGVKTAGFCSVSLGGHAMLWSLLHGGDPLTYPFFASRDVLDTVSGGVNHLSWFVSVRDRATGEDRYPEIRARLDAGETTGNPRADRLCRETGYLPAVADDHTQDFLPPDEHGRQHLPYHGGPDERARRMALLRDIADGDVPADPLFAKPAWERPLDFVAAMTGGPEAHLRSLNLVNAAGQVPGLPPQVFVETPVLVTANGPTPTPVALPESVLPYCRSAARVSDTLVRAARTGSRARVHEAVDLDPTIADKEAGRRAVDAALAAHADLLPAYD